MHIPREVRLKCAFWVFFSVTSLLFAQRRQFLVSQTRFRCSNPILTPTFTHKTLRKETWACRYAPTGFEVGVSLIGYAIITVFGHPSCI